MWHHILVPLDGTPGSELALPLAARIARRSGATLTLVHIQPPLPESTYLLDAAVLIAKIKETEREETEARRYLAHIVTNDCLDGIGVRTKFLAGPPVETLLQFAREQHVDLIVMCRHEHPGLQRWLSSHTVRHLARQSTIPILALHENGSLTSHREEYMPHPFSVMVALDGSTLAETALLPAAQLSAALSAPSQGMLHLLRIIQPLVASSESAELHISKLNTHAIIQARAYLDEVEWCIQHGHLAHYRLQVTSSLAEETEIARTLARDAELGEYQGDLRLSTGYDAIALATHGRSGLGRWLLGSVTEQVLDSTTLPVMIVRQAEDAASVALSETQTMAPS
jgi:nucleotide-binding universal stress UspA family protein